MISPSLKQFCFKSVFAAVVWLAMTGPWAWAQSLPPMPSDPELLLKPLVDNHQYDSEPQPSNLLDDSQMQGPLQGKVQRKLTPTSLGGGYAQSGGLPGSAGASGSNSSGGTKMLTGQVQTLQQAIESENGYVDWYAWYLSARDYLGRMGGLQCALGTPIKFYRNGRIEALTFNPLCQSSVAGRVFPLPAKTRLDAIILPVRAGNGPPASPDEIYRRINGNTGFP